MNVGSFSMTPVQFGALSATSKGMRDPVAVQISVSSAMGVVTSRHQGAPAWEVTQQRWDWLSQNLTKVSEGGPSGSYRFYADNEGGTRDKERIQAAEKAVEEAEAALSRAKEQLPAELTDPAARRRALSVELDAYRTARDRLNALRKELLLQLVIQETGVAHA